ncbi:MAG: response regulator [Nitrospirota bacterium]|nr:response regulator [Nitrospirota bacterium]
MTTPKVLLIVAHDRNSREMLEGLLDRLGYEFRSVASDAEALMMLKRWHFDGMLLDIDPRRGHYYFEVRQFLHERGAMLPILLVAISGAYNAESLVKDQHTDTVLSRPIQQEQLGRWLSQWVGMPRGQFAS